MIVSHSMITVHQCVFGYDDGHRMLAASTKLPHDTASLLLLLSDLGPGISFGSIEGYWTGVPLPSMKAYMLSRTWPAPEMPRPGCVWTHSLLIGFPDVARIPDFNHLRSFVLRPSRGLSLDSYTAPLVLDLKEMNPQRVRQDYEGFDNYNARKLLRAVYVSPIRQGIVEAPLGMLDTALFALWSQQWPRLRRSFAFRTAGGCESAIPSVRFDLQIISPSHTAVMSAPSSQSRETTFDMWERVAVEDLHRGEPTEFRRFLWRYGTDIQRGRERFQTLANLYIATRVSQIRGDTLRKVLANIVAVFPDKADGKTLKEDLISCGYNTYSLFPPSDALDMISFLFNNPSVALPFPPLEVLDTFRDQWEERYEQILTIAEQASAEDIPLGMAIIDLVAEILKPDQFLSLTRGQRRFRKRLVQANPYLLNSEDLTQEEPTEILELTSGISNNTKLIELVLERLVGVESPLLAEGLFTRFPDRTLKAVVKALDQGDREKEWAVPRVWLSLITDNRKQFLTTGLLNTAHTMRTLAFLAALLGYDHPDVLQVGLCPWVEALHSAQGQIEGTERHLFFAFLTALALHVPRTGSETLLQLTFEPLHHDLADDAFDPHAFSLLSRYLPDLYVWQQWDRCLRLRLAVVDAYVEHDLDPSTFPLLCKSARLREDLMALAQRTRRGKRFLEGVPTQCR